LKNYRLQVQALSFYFSLAFKRFRRKLSDLGIHPWLGITLIVLAFVLLSVWLFTKTEYASWVYLIIAMTTLLYLSEKRRVEQLKIIFSSEQLSALRLIENGLAVAPFIIFLTYMKAYWPAIILFPFSIVLAFFSKHSYSNFVLPTPFKKKPFEFIVGFRTQLWVLVLTYCLVGKAIQVDNYNLAVVCLGLVFLIALTFYGKLENTFYVWIYGSDAPLFLRKKLLTAWYGISLLTLPIFVILCVLYPENLMITLAVLIVGYLYLAMMVFAKYSAFPKELQVPQAILLALSLWFPPMLVVVIPLFYRHAIKQLNTIIL